MYLVPKKLFRFDVESNYNLSKIATLAHLKGNTPKAN